MNDCRTKVDTLPDLADSTFISYFFDRLDCTLTFRIESWDARLIIIYFLNVSYFVEYGSGGYTRSLWKSNDYKQLDEQLIRSWPESISKSGLQVLFQFNAYSSEDGFEIEDRTYDIIAEDVIGQEYETDCDLLVHTYAEMQSAYKVELSAPNLKEFNLLSYQRRGESVIVRLMSQDSHTALDIVFSHSILIVDSGIKNIGALYLHNAETDLVRRALMERYERPPSQLSFKHYSFLTDTGNVGMDIVASGINYYRVDPEARS